MENRNDTWSREAPGTAERWLRDVVFAVDTRFGEGYARDNPALVVGMLQAAASDYSATMLTAAVDRLAGAIETGLDNLGRR